MDDVTRLISLWVLNALLALSGVVYYGVLWLPAWGTCGQKEVRADAGVLRVCRRRLFRYTSRIGLKGLLLIYCLLRARIIWETALEGVDVPDDSWAAVIAIMLVLLWLTFDTILARKYD